jgi:nucleoside-diphosphate-sugar epimerase
VTPHLLPLAPWFAWRVPGPRLGAFVLCAAVGPVRFLVTGATGFIGRRLLAEIVRRHGGHSVACFVHDSHASAATERETARRYDAAGIRLIHGDLTRDTVSDHPPPAPDVVFHLAANIDTNASDAAAQVNDRGTANLIRWLGDHLRGRRLVYASSVAVCDRDGPADGALDEHSPPRPRTAYGRTKLRGEVIVRQSADRIGCTYTILRFPTVYGPGQKRGGMFDLLLRYASDGAWLGRLNWPGRTSIVHVDDAARIMLDLSDRPDAVNQTLCVASDDQLTVADIARKLGARAGHPIDPIDLPRPIWTMVRWIAWNRTVARLVPRSARVAHWRLGLIADDGFWQSAEKLRTIYPRKLMTLDEGMDTILDATRNPLPRQ